MDEKPTDTEYAFDRLMESWPDDLDTDIISSVYRCEIFRQLIDGGFPVNRLFLSADDALIVSQIREIRQTAVETARMNAMKYALKPLYHRLGIEFTD